MDFNVENLYGLTYIENILNSPLSKFITFSSRNCGYTGTTHYLMVNWVHPVFIKAKDKSRKEENTNWWEVMSED